METGNQEEEGQNKVREAGRVRGTTAAIINHLPRQPASCESASVILTRDAWGMEMVPSWVGCDGGRGGVGKGKSCIQD